MTVKLDGRLSALEARSGNNMTQVIRWYPGLSFDECRAQSRWPVDAEKRMLIELQFVEPSLNGPVAMQLTANELVEQAKARSWANELEAA